LISVAVWATNKLEVKSSFQQSNGMEAAPYRHSGRINFAQTPLILRDCAAMKGPVKADGDWLIPQKPIP